MSELVDIAPGRSLVIAPAAVDKPHWGVWVVTMPDATYLIVGQFASLAEARSMPKRADQHGQWFTFREIQQRFQCGEARWPPKTRAHEAAFSITEVDFIHGRITVNIGSGHRRQ